VAKARITSRSGTTCHLQELRVGGAEYSVGPSVIVNCKLEVLFVHCFFPCCIHLTIIKDYGIMVRHRLWMIFGGFYSSHIQCLFRGAVFFFYFSFVPPQLRGTSSKQASHSEGSPIVL
jgi:hypothetical protein